MYMRCPVFQIKFRFNLIAKVYMIESSIGILVFNFTDFWLTIYYSWYLGRVKFTQPHEASVKK